MAATKMFAAVTQGHSIALALFFSDLAVKIIIIISIIATIAVDVRWLHGVSCSFFRLLARSALRRRR